MTESAPWLVFHHIGMACRSLDVEARSLAALGYRAEAPDFTDEHQGVVGRFLVGPGPRLELLRPLEGHGTLDPFLAAGTKMYHQAFETPELDPAVAHFKATARARTISPPAPAIAFAGRHVTFLILPTLLIIELVEMER